MDASKSPFDDPEILGKSESAIGDASSATAIFGTVSAKPAPQQDDDLLKSLMGAHSSPSSVAEPPGPTSAEPPQTQPWTPVGPPTPATQVVPSSGPGEFTEIFQALQNPAPASTSTPAAPPAAAYTPSNAPPKTPADLANVFTQVVVEKTIFTPPPAAPPPSKASEFTQLLQTLNASTQKPEPEVAAPPQPPAAGTPGTFTQLFNTVSARPTEAPQTSAIPPWSAPFSSPTQSFRSDTPAGPGDFTRVFQSAPAAGQAVSSPVVPSTPAQSASGPGSFTEMFSAKPMESTPSENPLKSLKSEPPPPNTFQFSSPARPQESMPPAQGGFTQLLQALNKEEPVKAAEPVMAPPPLQPVPAVPAAGGFTQLLQTLSAEPSPKQAGAPPVMPPVQPAPAVPSVSGGPGEFTRIISGSQLRDLQAQSAPVAAPVAPPQAARPGVPPMQFPQAPPFPAAPSIPQIPAAHSAAAPPAAMPHFQPPAFQFPPAPAPPAPPPPVPSKLQQYLPLILILNIFVLLVIVLILIFVLRHR